ncbi:MAG: CNP1-like family protein [Comamonas sp.]
MTSALAQQTPPSDDAPKTWVESPAPPPPAIDLQRLIPVYVGPASSLSYGIDPHSITIDGKDRVVRYVIVARSTSGTVNVLYDGIRCETGEIKTYARAGADGQWRPQDKAQWRDIDGRLSAAYGVALIEGGLCIGKVPNGPAARIIDALRHGGLPAQQG